MNHLLVLKGLVKHQVVLVKIAMLGLAFILVCGVNQSRSLYSNINPDCLLNIF